MFIGRREYLADLETLWRKRPVLVYAGELAKSVEADGFFDTIVPARRGADLPNLP